ncbi:MAG: sulfatase [Actinomycetota bacterium]
MNRFPRRSRVTVVVAIVLLVVIPLVPDAIAGGSPFGLLRLPIESIVAILVLAVLPWRPARIAIAVVFALVVVSALALAGLDAAFEYALDIHFDPTDWPEVNDGYGVVQDSIGPTAAMLVLIVVALVAVAAMAALAWAALRVDGAIRRRRRNGAITVTAATAAWAVLALTGAQLVSGAPLAASASAGAIGSAASRAELSLGAQAGLSSKVRADPYSAIPASGLLTSLRGKDVIIAFIESYGQVAVQGTGFSDGVDSVLEQGQSELSAAGYSSQSAWLNSPTFGGLSWLAHSTLESGVWANTAPIYSSLIRSDRFTLSDAFRNAGWRTVSDVPSDTKPWPFGTSFYHYQTLYNSTNVGYQGPKFGYAQIPDQYTWQYFADHELAGPHQPVMAEIDLVSSHTPWAPLPTMVPPAQVGDGSIYEPQPAEGRSAESVWKDPKLVQQAYGQSIQYSLDAMFSFLRNSDDPNLVVIALGDHQPATIVSGTGADHEVPISIISKDPSVFHAISGWHWVNGLRPTPGAPVWPMDDFRDRFLTAFDKKN